MNEKKKLWLRVGVTLELSEEEYNLLRGVPESAAEEKHDEAKKLLVRKMKAGQYILDGETYSPIHKHICMDDEWPGDEGISYDFDENMEDKTDVKVILYDGCVSHAYTNGAPVSVEVINIDKNYDDKDQLEMYEAQIRNDPAFRDCECTSCHFESPDEEEEWDDFENPKPLHGTNTEINYLYRDGCNYKVFQSAIVAGLLTPDQMIRIRECCFEGDNFVPSKVGLPERSMEDEGFAHDEEIDTPFFELDTPAFEGTDKDPTIVITAKELVDLFEIHKDRWLV